MEGLMTSLIVSTIVFFVAMWGLKRGRDEIGMTPDRTGNALIFCLAMIISYGADYLVSAAIKLF